MIAYLALRLAIFSFGYLPFWVLYRFSDCLACLFYHLRIRKKTITDNLTDAFSQLSDKQIKKLIKAVYKNFFDVMFVEALKGFTASSKTLLKRFDLCDLELINDYYRQNKSVIVVMAHYANWEWGVTFPFLAKGVAFYKPIKNKYIDKYVCQNRARHHCELASIENPALTFLKHRHELTVYALIADKQNSKKRDEKRVMWLPFLGKESPFLLGPERYAKAFNYPVLYAFIQRTTCRGRYQHRFILVSDDPKSEDPGNITKRWAALLEKQVTTDPAGWLWFWAATRSRQQKI